MRISGERSFTAWVGVIVLGIVLHGAIDAAAASPQGVLREAVHMSISADWLDPATNGGIHFSANLPLYFFHDALAKPMPEGIYTPCLAESWSVSPDAKVYEFRLRKGVKFHNGDEMTAEDVVFSFWRNKTPQVKSIQGKTEKVEALNPNQVRFTFKEALPDFLDSFVPGSTSVGWVVPKKYVEKVGDGGFKKQPVGAGPYKFVEFVPGVKLVGEAFEDYWRKTPRVKRIELYTIPEPATRLAMVRRGEMDAATFMTGVFYEDAKKDSKLKLLSPLSGAQFIASITAQWDPKSPWSDPRVRKAASLAIDRQALADVHMPGCGPIGSLGLEGDPLAVKFPADAYDVERAKKLLAEAGYPKGFHGGKCYPYNSTYWPMGEQVATYWKAVGISVDTVLLDRPAWVANREGGKMKGGIFVEAINAPTVGGRFSYLFGPISYGNYPDIQALWDQYRKEIASQTRKDLIGRIQRLVYEKTMFVPLVSTNSPAVFSPKVKGNPCRIQPLLWFTAPFEDIEME